MNKEERGGTKKGDLISRRQSSFLLSPGNDLNSIFGLPPLKPNVTAGLLQNRLQAANKTAVGLANLQTVLVINLGKISHT